MLRILCFTCLLIPAISFTSWAQTVETLTTGTSWTVPCGVTSVQVECIGGGGAGGGNTVNNNAGSSGGGGGAYSRGTFTVTPGASINYVIGAAGVGSNGNGTDGGNTSWNVSDVIAEGGKGAFGDGAPAGSGGLASNSTGTTKYDGGSGFTANTVKGGGGGGSGGSNSNGGTALGYQAEPAVTGGGLGGDGGNGDGMSGVNAWGVGGGGGGAGDRSGGSESGGNGFLGHIKLTYTPALNSTLTIGPSGDDYTTIAAALVDLACTGASQPYVLELQSDYVGTVESYPLTLTPITGMSAINTITIRPASGATGLSLESSSTTAVYVDDADYFIFDGRPGGVGMVNELTIRNLDVASPVNPALILINDASNNVFRFVNIESETTASFVSEVISIQTSTGTTGNDDNTFSYCRIGDRTDGGATAAIPRIGLYSAGTVGKSNSGNVVDNCEFVDIWEPSVAASGNLQLGAENDAWTITNNHFYQTASIANCDNTTNFIRVLSGGDYLIDGNFLGGQDKNCGGSSFLITSGNAAFEGIHVNTTTGVNTITNNVISNIQYTTTSTTASLYPLVAMNLNGGSNYDVGTAGNGNVIGATSGIGSFVLTNNAASGSLGYVGIKNTSTGTVNISYNTFGAVTLNGSRNFATSKLIENTAGTTTVDNNTLGGTTANNILISSNSALFAVDNSSSNVMTVNNNTFQNWDMDATTASVVCVFNQAAGGGIDANNNIFKDLNINSTFNGIKSDGTGTYDADGNTFQDITISGSGSGAFSAFFVNSSGAANITNNIIGSPSANNMSLASNALHRVISNQGSGTATISGNIIQNFDLSNTGTSTEFRGISNTGGTSVLIAINNTITNSANVSVVAGDPMYGIYISNAASGHNIEGNSITNLFTNTTGGTSTHVQGIYVNGGDGTIQKNMVKGLENKATGAGPVMSGINITAGTWSAYNNVVILDNGSNTNDVVIFGMYDFEPTSTINAYHNTIVLGGSVTGTNYSACYMKDQNGPINMKNNVFQNNRTGGSANYAIYSFQAWAGTNDFNYLEVTENVNNTAYDNGTPYNLAGWKTLTTANNTLSGTISVDANGYSSGVIQSAGTNLTGDVPQDKDGLTRSSTPWMGAFEGPVKDKDGTITPGAGAEPVTISSIIDTDGEKILVFDFSLDDLGTSDGLTTVIDSLEITPGSANGVADWTKAIAGANISGPDLPSGINAVINPSSLGFRTGSPGIITIADGSSETYILKIWLKTDLSAINDNDVLEFRISNTEIYNDNTKSGFTTTNEESGDGNIAIDITASELRFVTNKPPADVNTNNNFEVEVNATDENGNVDADETSSVTLAKLTGSGILSSASGLTQSLVTGNYYWNDVQYNTSETFTIEAQSATMTNASSISITAVFATVIAVGDGQTYNNIEDAYNTGIPATIAGPYIIELMSDYNDANESPPITISQKTGHSAANTITIRPAFGVSGTEVALNPGTGIDVFTLDGCDFIRIDGRPGGIGSVRDFSIRNTRTTATIGNVFELKNDASNNILTYLNIESETPANAIIKVGPTTGANGNDFNTISFCKLSDLTVGGTAALPVLGIYSIGSVGKANDNNTVTNCEFVDIFDGTGANSFGVFLDADNDVWTITNNDFYQTVNYANCNNAAGFLSFLSGGGYTITGNDMGGRAVNAGGSSFTITSGTSQFSAIIFNSTAGGGPVVINSNRIANLNYTTTMTSATNPLLGIVPRGSSDFTVGALGAGNTIGSASATGDITLTNNAGSGSLGFSAIKNLATGTVSIAYNTIGGITLNGTRTGATTILINNTSGVSTIDNNLIGNSISNNILISSDSPLSGIESSSASGSTVSNNTVQNFNHNASTSVLKGISNSSGAFTCTDNMIQNLSTAGNVTHNFIDHSGGVGTITANTIQNITLTSTGTGLFNGINLNSTSAVTVSSNVIGSASLNNITIDCNDFYSNGINSTGSGALTCTGNTVQQVNMTSTGSTTFQGISTTAGVLTFNQNTIKNITTASNAGGGNVIIGIYCNSTSSGHVIGQNTVKNLVATESGALANLIRGIRISNGSGLIEKNNFSDFEMAYSSTSASIDVINITTGTWDVFNNVVLISNGSNVNSVKIEGILISGTGIANVYHNTAKISGTVSSGTAVTSAFLSTNTGTVTVKNNIFQNLRTGGTGNHYAENSVNTGTFTTNYNYIENVSAGNLCNYGGTDYNLAGWKGAPVNASNSLTGTETIDASGYAEGSVVANVGTNLSSSVADDKNGATRPVSPWMGAYESTFPLCGVYTIGGATPDFATFTDAVNSLTINGISCPVTFNVRNGTYVEQFELSSYNGVSSSDTVLFTSESGDSTLVTLTNSVDYKLWTSAPSVAIPDNTCPGVNDNIVVSGMTTTYPSDQINVTVSISHAYVGDLEISLTAPNGDKLELARFNGGGGTNYTNTRFADFGTSNVTNAAAPFTGTFQPEGGVGTCVSTTVSTFAGFGGGTIDPNGTWVLTVSDFAATVSGTLLDWRLEFGRGNYTVQFEGASEVTFDQMTIEATHTNSCRAVYISTASNDIRIQNCEVKGADVNSNLNSFDVISSDVNLNNNTQILNNRILEGSVGVYLTGSSDESGSYVSNNVFEGQYASAIYLTNQIAPSIIGNTIVSTTEPGYVGMEIISCDDNMRITNNKVTKTGGDGTAIKLSSCVGTSSLKGLIANNMIQVGGTTTAEGLEVFNSHYQDIYHNSIHIDGTSAPLGICFRSDVSANLVFKNNILYNSGGGYCIVFVTAPTPYASDFNDIYSTGSFISSWPGNQATLASYQSASSQDASSVSVDPLFVSSVDLHLTASSPIGLQGGTDLNADVPLDIDGDSHPTTPWMGADEFVPLILYYYQNSGNWNDNTKWFNASNGVSPCTCVPDNTYDVIFDANSFTGGGQVITIPAGTHNAKSLDFQDPATQPAFKGSGSLIIGQ